MIRVREVALTLQFDIGASSVEKVAVSILRTVFGYLVLLPAGKRLEESDFISLIQNVLRLDDPAIYVNQEE